MCTISSRRGSVAALALVAALLGACGGDDGPDDGGNGGGGGTISEVPLGTSQLSAADRATVAAALGAVAAEMAGTDPAGAAVVQAIGGAVAAEGWVNGVEATSALSLVAAGRGNLSAQNTWAVFGAEIGVITGSNPVTGYAVRGVVALRDSTIVVGYNRWDINDAFQPQHTFGNGPESVGIVFEGSTRRWNATAGSVQITTADSLPSQCSGFPRDGITCTNSSHASGSIGISTSVPEPGTGASGSYTFFFGEHRLRGYVLGVDCQQSSQC